MKKNLTTDPTSSNIANIMGLLTETPIKLEALSKSVSVKGHNQPLDIGERSLTEILAHLVNSEARTSEAIYLALLMKEPLVANVHSEKDWGRLLRYDLSDFNELLGYFKFRRAAMLRVLAGLNESQWSRSIRKEGKQRKETVYWRARSLALHEAEHILDVERKMHALK